VLAQGKIIRIPYLGRQHWKVNALCLSGALIQVIRLRGLTFRPPFETYQ
jgi:hypothetical protein